MIIIQAVSPIGDDGSPGSCQNLRLRNKNLSVDNIFTEPTSFMEVKYALAARSVIPVAPV